MSEGIKTIIFLIAIFAIPYTFNKLTPTKNSSPKEKITKEEYKRCQEIFEDYAAEREIDVGYGD
jgi:hypothetical protein